MLKLLSKLGAVVTVVLAVIAVTVALLGIAVTIPLGDHLGDKSFKALIVRSGSMEPTIPVGSLIVTLKQKDYRVGEIVTFKQKDSYVTHRIVGAFADRYWTKGDANAAPDGSPLPSPTAVGKLKWTLPYAGFAVNFARTPAGFSLLIVFPALLIIIQEILAIGRELEKEKIRKRRLEEKILDMRKVPSRFALEREMMKEKAGMRRRVSQAVSMMLVALVAGVGGTKAYFSDVETSTDNVFTAGTWVIEPQGVNHLLIHEVSYTHGDNDNWVEIYNPTSLTIDLSDYKVGDSESLGDTTEGMFEFPEETIIDPGEFMTIASHAGKYFDKYGFHPDFETKNHEASVPDMSEYTAWGTQDKFKLSIQDDEVLLLDDSDAIVDAVVWGDSLFSGCVAMSTTVANDHSIERKPKGVDTNNCANDFVDRFTPTPDFALPDTQTVVLNEFMVKPDPSEFIELYNKSAGSMDITGWKIARADGTVVTTIGTVILAAGGRHTINYNTIWGKEPIYLKDASSVIQDAFTHGALIPAPGSGTSEARIPDGAENWQEDPSETPNAANIL